MINKSTHQKVMDGDSVLPTAPEIKFKVKINFDTINKIIKKIKNIFK